MHILQFSEVLEYLRWESPRLALPFWFIRSEHGNLHNCLDSVSASQGYEFSPFQQVTVVTIPLVAHCVSCSYARMRML